MKYVDNLWCYLNLTVTASPPSVVSPKASTYSAVRLHLDIHTLEYGLFAMYGAHGYPLATIFADAYA